MSQRMGTLLRQNAPWRKTTAWWIVLLQGFVTLGMGIYFLLQPRETVALAVLVMGGYLLVTSVLSISASLRGEQRGIKLVREGIGVVTGLAVVLQPFLHTLTVNTSRLILAAGLALSALVGLYGVFNRNRGERFQWSMLFTSILNIVLALLLLGLTARGALPVFNLIGLLAIIIGLLLITHAMRIFRARSAAHRSRLAES